MYYNVISTQSARLDFAAVPVALEDGTQTWQRGEGLDTALLVAGGGGRRTEWVPAVDCAAGRTWEVVDSASEAQWRLLHGWIEGSGGLWEGCTTYWERRARKDASQTLAVPPTVYGGRWG